MQGQVLAVNTSIKEQARDNLRQYPSDWKKPLFAEEYATALWATRTEEEVVCDARLGIDMTFYKDACVNVLLEAELTGGLK